MTGRCSVHAESYRHGNPIPTASRIGPLLVSSVIAPSDPRTKVVPESADQQVGNLFLHIGSILEAARATWNDIARVEFFIGGSAGREAINPHWLTHFPDEQSQPARHTHIQADATTATCSFIAYITD